MFLLTASNWSIHKYWTLVSCQNWFTNVCQLICSHFIPYHCHLNINWSHGGPQSASSLLLTWSHPTIWCEGLFEMEPLCQNLALKDHCVSMTLLCQIMSCEISLVSGVGVLYTLQQWLQLQVLVCTMKSPKTLTLYPGRVWSNVLRSYSNSWFLCVIW